MIYTVTFNPSLDYIVRLDHFTAGEINRVNYEQVLAGGKGINVSIVLGNLGHASTALGFVAGFTGEEIKRQLRERGVTSNFVQLFAHQRQGQGAERDGNQWPGPGHQRQSARGALCAARQAAGG